MAEVVKRLQRHAGGVFYYLWRLACEQRDHVRTGLATYDPRHYEQFAADFIRDLRAADFGVTEFVDLRGLWIDWDDIREELRRQEGLRNRGLGKGELHGGKGWGKRPRDSDPAGTTARHRSRGL